MPAAWPSLDCPTEASVEEGEVTALEATVGIEKCVGKSGTKTSANLQPNGVGR
jgi:hypothetical protein